MSAVRTNSKEYSWDSIYFDEGKYNVDTGCHWRIQLIDFEQVDNRISHDVDGDEEEDIRLAIT